MGLIMLENLWAFPGIPHKYLKKTKNQVFLS